MWTVWRKQIRKHQIICVKSYLWELEQLISPRGKPQDVNKGVLGARQVQQACKRWVLFGLFTNFLALLCRNSSLPTEPCICGIWSLLPPLFSLPLYPLVLDFFHFTGILLGLKHISLVSSYLLLSNVSLGGCDKSLVDIWVIPNSWHLWIKLP